jgi:hypothetical protein
LRELRGLTTDNQQIGFVSSDRELELETVAASMMAEFTAARFLDHYHTPTSFSEIS